MKKLLTLLFVLSLLPVPAAFAETVEDQDLIDYLVLGAGNTWTYDMVQEETLTGEVTETTFTLTQSECDTLEDCIMMSSEWGDSTINIVDNVAYYTELMSTVPTQDYITLSTESFYQTIVIDDYALFAIEEWEEGATLLCEADYDDAYEFNGNTYEAITQNCILDGSIDGSDVRMRSEDVYLKGAGLVSSSSTTTIDSILFLESTTTLTASSLLAEMEAESGENPFSDVDSNDAHYDAIQYLYEEGVFEGYSDGTFRPENTVNRAELIKILVEAKGLTPHADDYSDCFSDVTDDWYAPYVCYAKEEGWVSGYPDGSFKPADTVNKVEALKMLLRSQDVELSESYNDIYEDVSADDWFAAYVQTASDWGLLEEQGSHFYPDYDRDREGIAEELYRLLTY